MNDIAQHFFEIGEPFAAGFFEHPDGSPAQRFCRAFRRYYEACPLSYIPGELLFPCGQIQNGNMTVAPSQCTQYSVDTLGLKNKSEKALEIFDRFAEKHNKTDGWVHSVLNYRRILAEGIDRYEERIKSLPHGEFKEALLDVLMGLRSYHRRALEYLKEINAPDILITALERVPFQPAQTVYEALVSLNFVLYLDYCDNVGRIDSYLYPYWKGEDITTELRRLMRNVLDNGKWSVTLGPDYNGITRQVLRASKGLARPMVQLRVTEEMPNDLWELALERVLSGGGQPSFYNEKVIQAQLKNRLPHVSESDLKEFVGNGCTETGFAGLTYCGGCDSILNVLLIFEKYMKESLSEYSSFEAFYEGFCARLFEEQDRLIQEVNSYYNKRAEIIFDPIRTLFTDDCIDNQKGFYQGGSRYVFAIPTDSGFPNTVDSLLAIKELLYDRKLYTADSFIKLLEAQEPKFLARLAECPCYGVGDAAADSVMYDLTSRFYARYKNAKLDIGDGFFPTSHQFNRHVTCGEQVGATPDGRACGTPVADSIAAVEGKAFKGPTMMLLSASKFAQKDIYGMAILNLTITRKYSPAALRALIEGYFAMGGLQMQITAVDKNTLIDAKLHPEKHGDLIVRVGGYSDYFKNLAPELQDAVIARTVF